MTTVYGYDAAYPPAPSVVKAAGGQLMAFYLTGTFAAPPTRAAEIHATGMGAWANYEEAADELVHCGRPGGQDIGRRSMAALLAQRPAPPANGTVGIVYSVDTNVDPSLFPQVGAAFDGINDVIAGKFVAHVYGEGALIDYLVATGRVRHVQWLSASSSFPGFNPAAADVGLVQIIGSNIGGTDQDEITNAAGLDAWWPAGSTLAMGDDDVFTDDDKAFIASELATARLQWRSDVLTEVNAALAAAPYSTAVSKGVRLDVLTEVNSALRGEGITAAAAAITDDPNGVLLRLALIQAAVSKLPQTGGGQVDPGIVADAVRTAVDGATINIKAAS